MAKKTKIPAKTLKYLDGSGKKYDILEHRTVYTAIDAAITLRKKFEEVAKSLLVKADKDYVMILLPADQNLDMDKLKKVIGKENGKDVKVIKIPGEKVMEKALKVKAGAMGSFGALHKLPVVVEKKLSKIKKAVFPSGSYNHAIEMSMKDFIDMEDAILGSFGVKKKIKKPIIKKPSKKKKTKKVAKKISKKKVVKKPSKKKAKK